MKICFQEGTHVVFLYSNDNGMKHLNKLLQDNPLFGNLFNIKDILEKIAHKLTFGFFINQSTGISSLKWVGQKISISSEEKDLFDLKYLEWKKELIQYLGKENLHEVLVPCDELDNLLDTLDNSPQDHKDKSLLEFLEKYQFSLHLNETLNEVKNSKSAKKI